MKKLPLLPFLEPQDNNINTVENPDLKQSDYLQQEKAEFVLSKIYSQREENSLEGFFYFGNPSQHW
jgi:hypothetical protein